MKKYTPYYSVIMPLYNKVHHVQRAISSVFNQNYSDFELIVINDASTDKGMELVYKFADNRIRLFSRSEPGPGGYAARNLGIKYARGEWLAFIDADDEWRNDHLEKMYSLCKLYPHVFFMGCGWYRSFNGEITVNKYYSRYHSKGPHLVKVREYFESCLRDMRPVHTSFACVRRNSPVAINLFPDYKKAKRGGDLHAWLKLINCHKEMAWSNHIGGTYYRDSSNMVTRISESSTHLWDADAYCEISDKLTRKETQLLNRYMNRRLELTLKQYKRKGRPHMVLLRYLNFKDDFIYALFLAMMSFFPFKVFNKARQVFKKLRYRD